MSSQGISRRPVTTQEQHMASNFGPSQGRPVQNLPDNSRAQVYEKLKKKAQQNR
jgi:hypothetical protein